MNAPVLRPRPRELLRAAGQAVLAGDLSEAVSCATAAADGYDDTGDTLGREAASRILVGVARLRFALAYALDGAEPDERGRQLRLWGGPDGA